MFSNCFLLLLLSLQGPFVPCVFVGFRRLYMISFSLQNSTWINCQRRLLHQRMVSTWFTAKSCAYQEIQTLVAPHCFHLVRLSFLLIWGFDFCFWQIDFVFGGWVQNLLLSWNASRTWSLHALMYLFLLHSSFFDGNLLGAAKQFLCIFFLCPSSQIIDDSGLGNWALAFSAFGLFLFFLFLKFVLWGIILPTVH